MQIETAVYSYCGGRAYNEDNVRVITQDGSSAVVVADGLGGHGGGQIASAIASEVITGAFMRKPLIEPEHIRCLFERANDAVVMAQTPAQKMKSTAVALFLKDHEAVWGHAGDSRLYYFKDGILSLQTLDHSVSQMAVFSGEITKEQIRHHDDRNRVLRAIGNDGGLKAEVSDVQTLMPGFHAFLLCTDGFWEYVWELEMELELAKAATAQDWIRGMTQRLARRVPKEHDNFSAAAVFLTINADH